MQSQQQHLGSPFPPLPVKPTSCTPYHRPSMRPSTVVLLLFAALEAASKKLFPAFAPWRPTPAQSCSPHHPQIPSHQHAQQQRPQQQQQPLTHLQQQQQQQQQIALTQSTGYPLRCWPCMATATAGRGLCHVLWLQLHAGQQKSRVLLWIAGG
jgi:hypothetical protein